MHPKFDERDAQIVKDRMTALDKCKGPREGDWVDFADGVKRRISYLWGEMGAQTSDESGGYHLGDYGVSYSGPLYTPVPLKSLEATEEKRPGKVWIFHHDQWQASNGVSTTAEFRVYRCQLDAPEH